MKNVIAIIGPTASGKTSLAIRLAKEVTGEIINFDSVQVYKGVDIVAALPTAAEQQYARHHLFAFRNPNEPLNAAMWAELAAKTIQQILAKGRTPILVGGTGLYLKTLTEGIGQVPSVPYEYVKFYEQKLATGMSVSELHKILMTKDEAAGKKLNSNDKQRVIRALSVIDYTNKSFSYWQSLPKTTFISHINFTTIALLPPREALYDLCNKRFDIMLNNGALQEVENLFVQKLNRNLPLLKSVGINQLLDYFQGEISLNEATEKAKTATRQYAKRQLTWIRNQMHNKIIFNDFGSNINKEQLENI